jgi:outer membrane receptor for ferrienterochelin and colicin
MIRKLLVLMLVMAFVPAAYAGITGKIAGIVKDTQTGEPLPGVNVLLEGTTLGASSDIDGYYVIVNVPVGVHEINVSYIGYKDILIYNVRVVSDASTRYDFEMEETLLEVSEVIEVIAKRELIAKDNTASRTIVTGEVINSQPVDNVTQTVGLTAGVTETDPLARTTGDGMSIRGGRPGTGEVKFHLDGVDVSNPIGYVNRGTFPGMGDADMATDVPEAGLEEVQVITGGIGAQYSAKSAVVSMVTSTGGKSYSGFVRMSMNPGEYGQGDIIPFDFGQASGYMTDEEAIAEAKTVGTGSRYVNNDYYASPDQMFVNRKFKRYQMSFGGPIPLTGLGTGGTMSFNLNADFLDRRSFYRGTFRKQDTYNGKLVYNTASNSSFVLSYLNSHADVGSYAHTYSRIVTTGDSLYAFTGQESDEQSNPVLVGSLVMPNGDLVPVENYDMLNNRWRPEEWSNMLSFSYKNTVSSKTFFELKVSRFETRLERKAKDPATGNYIGLADFKETRFNNTAASEFFPEGAPTATRLESYWWIQPMQVTRQRQEDDQVVMTYSGDLVSQLNEFNELRIGAEFKSYDLLMNYESWASGGNGYSTYFNATPRKFSAYVADKIETDGMIINAGLRFDYFDANGYTPDNFADPLLDEAIDPQGTTYQDPQADWQDRLKNPKRTTPITTVSPRIGISFPITESDVFHINYGHYSATPALGFMFDNYNWSLLGAFKYIGNPNLRDEKVISYEAGIEHGFGDAIKLAVTGFYKDMDDLINKKKFRDPATGIQYWVNVNSDYASAKGAEVSLATRRWNNIIANVAYTYQIARGINSDAEQAFLNDYRNLRPRTDDFYLDWDVRHTATLNVDYRVPQNWMDSKWLGDWGVNMILRYNSGRPYSSANNVPPPALPPINDERYPSRTIIDLRFFKNFPVWESVTFGAFFEVKNLTDQRTLLSIENDEQYYLGVDEGDGTWNRPDVWTNPRELRLGFEMRF